MIMADTDVVSFIFKEDTRGAFYAPLLAGKDVFISFMTLAELYKWAIAGNWGTARTRKLYTYLHDFTFFVIHSDDTVCQQWADVMENGKRKGKSIQPGDAWIAATALVHAIPLVTHNRKDYAGVEG